MREVVLDKLSGDHESATVVFWYVEEGDRIKEGKKFVKLSIEGKPFNFTSPTTGIVNEIYCSEGEEVRLEDVLATIDEEEGVSEEDDDDEVEEMEDIG
ncbi:MAG: hypothetical protein HYS07_00650 [Chlamydiae bacterium]|nr:hypothetical protein [Chlamydiota bacterium]MBI3278168.1 hypothetical protein [Chlamydiota bacterium]